MAFGNYKSFSLVFLAVAALAFASNDAEAQVNPFCNTATDKALCTSMVNEAKTQKEATVNAISFTLEKAKLMKPMVDGLMGTLPKILSLVSKDSLVQTCNDNYESTVDDLAGAIEDINTGDKFNSVPTKLSAVGLTDCADSLKDFNVVSPLGKLNDEINNYASSCLAVARQITSACKHGYEDFVSCGCFDWPSISVASEP
ncbi:hypothetical protein RJ639_000349 [Escallonia herrerae]|uniref:Pectinesterase inhibitor domain-containing protein n=1 Tax=Escallonia herrerae TaxID=1293975 RepID=A0AA89BI10_9ASTE|nr:hypothetical protein RJ639_000349 [Escallonia herrerae]